MTLEQDTLFNLDNFLKAKETIKEVALHTPLQLNRNLSEKYNANIYLKREDLQVVRSYKIRGAFNKIASLSDQEKQNGVICASAGNHAQGVALSCSKLNIKGVIFMPITTPSQKIDQVKMFGGNLVEIKLFGDTFDDCYGKSLEYSKEYNLTVVPPFDDKKVILGQGSVGLEIIEDLSGHKIDKVLLPIGGGGLASGVSSVFKLQSPETSIIGVEPSGAASMAEALKQNKIVKLKNIDKFVDGAAVQKVGTLNFEICKNTLSQMLAVEEGKICSTILQLYNKDAIVVEPAGALTIAALDQIKDAIVGENIVCVVSGSNNDISRMQEIKERSLMYEGLKHYFIVNFPQRPGALKEFVNDVLGPKDDITFFEYKKKNYKENGPVVIGLQLSDSNDLSHIQKRMKDGGFIAEYINNKPDLFQLLI
jgi:threonine dehydratase